MTGMNITFTDKNINKSNFHKNNKPFNIDETDVDKILVSKRQSYSKKDSLLSLDIMITVVYNRLF